MVKIKSTIIFVSLLALMFTTSIFADVRWYDGNADDHLWSNPYNWGSLGHVPTTSDGIVFVKPGLSATYGKPAPGADPTINSSEPNVTSIYVGEQAPGLAELTITDGGYMEVMTRFRLGSYITTLQTPITHGRLNMEGGVLDVLGTDGIQLGYRNSIGEIYMTGGVINTSKLWMKGRLTSNTTAKIELLGGTINAGVDQWDTTAVDDRPYNLINITEGTLRTGRALSSWYEATGLITAYDGLSTCNFDQTTEPGYTIVTANPYYKAYTPSPFDGAALSSSEAPAGVTILEWKAGTGAISHDVYFGTDESLVTSGDMSVYQGNVDVLSFDPNGLGYGQTYYWRIDEFDGSTTTTGDVWSFSVSADLPPQAASVPVPADAETGVSRLAQMSWTIGVGAISHDIYFGTDESLVALGDASVYQGNFPTAEFDPGLLDAGTTYYWRVDELDGSSIWEGAVWEFQTLTPAGDVVWVNNAVDDENWNTGENWNTLSVPTLDKSSVYIDPEASGMPVVDSAVPGVNSLFLGRANKGGESIVTIEEGGELTASALVRVGYYRPGSYERGTIVVNGGSFTSTTEMQVGSYGTSTYNNDGTLTINGGELNAQWIRLSAGTYSTGYINLNGGTLNIGTGGIEFNNEPEADRMRVSKMDIGAGTLVMAGDMVDSVNYHINLGNITAYGSADGGLLGEANFIEGGHPEASFNVSYDAVNDETIVTASIPDPKQAKSPYPGNSATDADVCAILSWTAGEGAVSHQIYFGTDEALVTAGDASVDMGSQAAATFDPGLLVPETQYFWRVDEFDGSTTTVGEVWNFTAGYTSMIDDFQSYADGTELSAVWTAASGSITALETDITNFNSSQAMKVNFAGSAPSVTMTFASAQDWTKSNIAFLAIPFHGAAANSATEMNVTLEDATGMTSQVTYGLDLLDEDASDVIMEDFRNYWTWHIDLARFGVDLTEVKKLTVTMGDGVTSTVGTVYFDDIYLSVPECIARFMPGEVNGDCNVDALDLKIIAENWLAADSVVTASTAPAPLAMWKFEGDATEENGLYGGSANGTVAWDATGGYDGNGCLSLNGAGYIGISGAETLFSNITDQMTISVWVKGDADAQPVDNVVFAGGVSDFSGHNPFSYMPNRNGGVTFDSGHISEQEPDWDSWFYGWDNITWNRNDVSDWEGAWVNYTYVKNSTEGFMRLYRNGELVAENLDAYAPMGGTAVFTIGALERGTYQSLRYTGKIDDMSIYNTVLTAEQIAALANQATVSQPLVTAADGNKDGKVDFADFAAMADYWLDQEVTWPY
ncbi:MAG: LamG-like jellyroll fold domain-containing protein [Sedimentisphaeraceae bacterium JB056]